MTVRLSGSTGHHGVPDEAALFAVALVLLHRLSQQESFTVGIAGADPRRLQATTVSSFTLSGGFSLTDVVQAARTALADARSGEGSDTGHTDDTSVPVLFHPGRPAPAFPLPSSGELLLAVEASPTGTEVEAHYDPRLHEAETVRRLLGHYGVLLEAGLTEPELPISELPILTAEEERRILVDWNRTAAESPYRGCLHEEFQARVETAPESTALITEDGELSFGQVDAKANRLARHLRGLGIGPGSLVGLCLEQSADLLVAVLAVLKAGGAYVPLDPGYPEQRLATMLRGVTCGALVSRSDLADNLRTATADSGPPLVLLDRDAPVVDALPDGAVNSGAGADSLCYVIYTSGSTGVPKPIALRHRGVVNNLADLNSHLGIGPGDKVLGLSSPSFDMSVYEMLGITLAGGTLVLPSRGRAKDPAHWAHLVSLRGVTVWNSAPVLLEMLVDHVERNGAKPPSTLRAAMLGGDWIPVDLPDRTRKLAPGLRFLALGGATEASIHSILFEVTEVDPDWPSIPYGRPMANQRAYVLDRHRRPVPPGVAGDLYLAGVGLAVGYVDQPERTAERFTEWSHGPVAKERVYRTGDLARYRPDGVIELLGRSDFQVKIRGLRIELGEVEAALKGHPAVADAVAGPYTDRTGDLRLVGYVTVLDRHGVDPDELHRHLASVLPGYMVPTSVMVLDAMPLSANGKLDRRALQDLHPEAQPPSRETLDDTWATDLPEQRIVDVWRQVLGVERVGPRTDFFTIGGDSLKAMRCIAGIDPRLTLGDILRNPTVESLSARLREIADDGPDGTP
ncbi:non-ribosomal peptide synthetase [Streptomyces sp. CBMA123]|uniref:non-ribosomal peptide synthetase n=1 Tax=Streptomyces sp. CBMA123 TaxID=1896313 RepID=UPI0016618D48|nr:amino acid adenylation domain-containing protein [Streptomyces sp. CBMA123]